MADTVKFTAARATKEQAHEALDEVIKEHGGNCEVVVIAVWPGYSNSIMSQILDALAITPPSFTPGQHTIND